MKDDQVWNSGASISPPIILLQSAISGVSHLKFIGPEDTLIRMIRSDVILTGVMPQLFHRRDFDLPKLDVTVVVYIYIALLERVLRGSV